MSHARWPALLTGPLAQEFLGINQHALRQLVAEEYIHRVQIPTMSGARATRFRRVDLERFVEELPVGINQQPEQLNPTVVASEERRAGAK